MEDERGWMREDGRDRVEDRIYERGFMRERADGRWKRGWMRDRIDEREDG